MRCEIGFKTTSIEVRFYFYTYIFLKILPFYLEVYDHCENKDGRDEVHEIWQVLSVEGLSKGAHLVCACGQQVKQSNDGSLKLSAWKIHRNKLVF